MFFALLLEIYLAKLSFGEIWKKYPEDPFEITKIAGGAAEWYLGLSEGMATSAILPKCHTE